MDLFILIPLEIYLIVEDASYMKQGFLRAGETDLFETKQSRFCSS